MPNSQQTDTKTEAGTQKSTTVSPSISLPKGGGAIRGIGEKFAANPVTGTGSMTVPFSTSPGRSGFDPKLTLSYDSGHGNSEFGFGWSLSLPSITRKTDKGLPQYRDAEESDVYILSGAEDLVPALKKAKAGGWVRDEFERDGYSVRRYRPRIEGLFARIERWTHQTTGEVHWRSISKDNITTLYGKTPESRIADPADAQRVFSWMICESYDDQGNAIVYEYAEEDDNKIDRTQVNEKNRVRTANRYLKRIKYGNRTANRDANTWQGSDSAQLPNETWMFDVVFDYGEGHYSEDAPDAQGQIFASASTDAPANSIWPARQDSFSSYRAGFEVRTYRLCRRVLMFHHFPQELGIADYLVRSTEFSYTESPIASFITSVTQSGYVRHPTQNQPNRYLKNSLPPLEFEYSQVPPPDKIAQQPIRDVDTESLENLPVGLDAGSYQWMDLDGEGTYGVLTEQADGWYYKRNLSANRQVIENGHEHTIAQLGPTEVVARKPANGLSGGAQFLDLAGDGQVDLVQMEGPVRGFYERTEDADWERFQPFISWPNLNTRDPNLKFIDLNGDGHPDMLITDDQAFTWYPSLAEEGFGPAERVMQSFDEEKGPRLVFNDGTQSIYLADLSGDGLSDLVRIRNGEVCYWPNRGYGRFGTKVTMDNAPWFDAPDQFDQRRIRLVDTDGSGTIDILYLRRDGVQIYFNQSGNRWSDAVALPQFPPIDNISSVQALDLLGNGTGCLVWSSPLPGDSRRPMRYIALMDEKPHLLVGVKNNLGAETVVHYAPSTKFYLNDKEDGKPWITRLPFPVHVVERVETYDLISRNRFVTRYAYHHGYYDGIEREFRGFGIVEKFDTEELAALTESGDFPDAANIDAASYVPTVLTRTWFHTGAYIEGGRISRHFEDEYYHEGDESEGVPGLTDQQLEAMLLPDTKLPTTLKQQDGSSIPWELTAKEIQEACRALKGAVLRREIFALDGTDDEDRLYSATEQNYTVELLQPQGEDRHAVFFTHPRESIDFHFERRLIEVLGKKITDPRVTHAMTLAVDGYGNVLKSVAIGYGRRPGLSPLQDNDKKKQEQLLITCTENAVTNPINEADDYRTPLPCEARTYELLKIAPDSNLPDITNLFGFDEMVAKAGQAGDGLHDLPYEDIHATGATANHPYRRLIEHVRTLYRRNDMAAALPLGQLKSLAIPFESYKLAFTPGLITGVYGAKVTDAMLTNDGRYVHSEGDANWWIPSGRIFFSPGIVDTPAQELAHARQHFFLPHRYRDPFHTNAVSTENFVTFDAYDLLMLKTRDALGNTAQAVNEYRVLQPKQMTDPNGNRSEVAFDTLGLVAGTAVMGKATETLGDMLDASFDTEPTHAQLDAFMANPREASANTDESVATQIVHDLLGKATTRIIYDLDRFKRLGEPPFAATVARETHVSELQPDQQTKIQIGFSYSDGFGREIQKKIQAEPGPVVEGGPIVDPRWVGSGWTIFNNKGKPVRQYEPFFDDTHGFKFGVAVGVSPVLFYDPVERVIATLHPNHTWEKVVFDPWQQTTYDVNDTVTFDPKTDDDAKEFFTRLLDAEYLPTWHGQRSGGQLGSGEQAAAKKAAVHADTPTVTYFDTLGRPFLTIAHNKFERRKPDDTIETIEEEYSTRLELDIEGNQRAVRDAIEQAGDKQGRIVMRYDYDMLSNRIHQASMEAGERWMLNDVAGKPLYGWDSRDHQFRNAYDQLRRPTDFFLREGAGAELLVGHSIYGESRPNPEAANLRGKAVQLFDQAGVVTSDEYDFKGNLLRSQRQLAQSYKTTLDWSVPAQLEAPTYTGRSRHDALNRPTQLIVPHIDQAGTKVNVIQPIYNEANLLEQVHVWLNQNAEPVGWLEPATANLHAVSNIDYNAKGQRTLIDYGNGTSTVYDYDPLTFRLLHLLTRRNAVAFPDDCPQPSPAGWPGCQVQNFSYIYDPAGNITHIRDDAQQTIYFRNKRVEPSADYTYDAIYRLIEATGREHLGQVGSAPIPHSYNDAPRVGIDWSANDGNAMGTYVERYIYDAVGNFLEMQHRGSDPVNPGWTRAYAYNEASLIEPSKQSNRLSSTIVGNGNPITEQYGYDAHGNMLHMPQLQVMQWDFKDQLQMTRRQAVNVADADGVQHQGERTWYVYDASGHRVRKITERQASAGTAPARMKERIYIGSIEIYREYGTDGNAISLERDTLQLMDDKQRIALVETRTQGDDPAPQQLIRYQFGNHLGSASLELDDQAQIISYKEYTPYGSMAYQAVRIQTETPKRYCYTGKERDEETGLYYFGARYYPPWLGRWSSADPIGIKGGINLYEYAAGNPVRLVDPTGHEPTTTYLGSSKEEMYVARLEKTWGGNQYWSDTGSGGSGWYVKTEGSKILAPPEQRRFYPVSPDEITFGPEPGEYVPPIMKEVSPEEWDVVELPLGPAVHRQEATVEEARKAIHEEAVVRDNAELALKAASEFVWIFSFYAGRTRGTAPPLKPAGAAAIAAQKVATAGKFGAEDVAFGIARPGGTPGVLAKFAGEAQPATRATLSEATRALALGPERNVAIAEDTLKFAQQRLQETGGRVRFNLTGFDVQQALSPGSPNYNSVTSVEFRGILNNAELRGRTSFYDPKGVDVTQQILQIAGQK